MINVVWTCQTFENNFGTKHKFPKYLNGYCRKSSDEQFSIKYFLYIAFIREISLKLSGGFGRYRPGGIKYHSKQAELHKGNLRQRVKSYHHWQEILPKVRGFFLKSWLAEVSHNLVCYVPPQGKMP